jgi:hypothetical protein
VAVRGAAVTAMAGAVRATAVVAAVGGARAVGASVGAA